VTHSRVPIDVYKFIIAYYGGERHAPFVDFLAEHYEGRFASVVAPTNIGAPTRVAPRKEAERPRAGTMTLAEF